MSRWPGFCTASRAVASSQPWARPRCVRSRSRPMTGPAWRATSRAYAWVAGSRLRGLPFGSNLVQIDRPRNSAMAGHSQFKNIMHRKGRQDAVKSKLFGKLAREITVSAKMGLPDPNMNARLRAAILAARAENMSKDSIERAIKKAAGNDTENYDEIRYEGYGPGGVAVIVEVLTDNRNRTAGEVRAAFTKSGGNLAETGAVAFMFDHVGVVEYGVKAASADAMLEAAIDAGAEDVVSSENGHEVFTTPDSL